MNKLKLQLLSIVKNCDCALCNYVITLLYRVRMPATQHALYALIHFMCCDCACLSTTNKACKLGGKPPYARSIVIKVMF